MSDLSDHIPDRFLDADGQLDEPLSREEVEDLFSPGTLVLQHRNAYHIADLVPGPDLLGTVEDDTSLWVTFEESRAAIHVGNALHALENGGWRLGDPEAVEQTYVECSECGTLRDENAVLGEFVPGAAFCSRTCQDDYLDREATPGIISEEDDE